MKKQSAAVLLIMSLFVLAGCRVAPAGETGVPTSVPTSVPATPSATPLSSPAPPEPEPTESEPPAPVQSPEQEEETVALPTPQGMSEEARYQFALAWCEDNKSIFHHADLYAMDRSYWFADWIPELTGISFEGGNVVFFEDRTGAMTPAEAAAAVFQQAGACFETGTPEDWTAVKERLARKAAQEVRGDEEDLSQYLAGELAAHPDFYLGIGEDMWLCGPMQTDSDTVALDTGWYVVMKQGNVYRLQWDQAFSDYVQLPEVQVRVVFDKALEAYRWFGGMPLPYDGERSVTLPEGGTWFAVDYPEISTALELRTYLKALFSDEIVDSLMSAGLYQEIDGVLYVLPVDGGYMGTDGMTASVHRESETKVIYRLEGFRAGQEEAPVPVTLDFPYEKVGEKWVFTEFNWGD